jgi:hypothetical protein
MRLLGGMLVVSEPIHRAVGEASDLGSIGKHLVMSLWHTLQIVATERKAASVGGLVISETCPENPAARSISTDTPKRKRAM